MSGIRVLVRVKPHSTEAPCLTVDTASTNGVLLKQPSPLYAPERFNLDAVLGESATQADTFASALESQLEALFKGLNVSVLLYGATGTGKTFGAIGGPGSQAGLIPRAAQWIFERAAAIRTSGAAEVSISCQLVEVYNEQIRDLQAPFREDTVARLELIAPLAGAEGSPTGPPAASSTTSGGDGGAGAGGDADTDDSSVGDAATPAGLTARSLDSAFASSAEVAAGGAGGAPLPPARGASAALRGRSAGAPSSRPQAPPLPLRTTSQSSTRSARSAAGVGGGAAAAASASSGAAGGAGGLRTTSAGSLHSAGSFSSVLSLGSAGGGAPGGAGVAAPLLTAAPSRPPRVVEHRATGAVTIEGAVTVPVSNRHQVVALLNHGLQTRMVAATDCNAHSSRSHLLFILNVALVDSLTGESRTAKLTLVDLAGSENVASSGAEGDRKTEAGMINKSLLALGLVINTLTTGAHAAAAAAGAGSAAPAGGDGTAAAGATPAAAAAAAVHVPYRNSVLTMLLKDSLGGNSLTSLVLTINPGMSAYQQSKATLQFGARAKQVRNNPRANVTRSASQQSAEVTSLTVALRRTEAERDAHAKLIEEMQRIAMERWGVDLQAEVAKGAAPASGSAGKAPFSPEPHRSSAHPASLLSPPRGRSAAAGGTPAAAEPVSRIPLASPPAALRSASGKHGAMTSPAARTTSRKGRTVGSAAPGAATLATTTAAAPTPRYLSATSASAAKAAVVREAPKHDINFVAADDAVALVAASASGSADPLGEPSEPRAQRAARSPSPSAPAANRGRHRSPSPAGVAVHGSPRTPAADAELDAARHTIGQLRAELARVASETATLDSALAAVSRDNAVLAATVRAGVLATQDPAASTVSGAGSLLASGVLLGSRLLSPGTGLALSRYSSATPAAAAAASVLPASVRSEGSSTASPAAHMAASACTVTAHHPQSLGEFSVRKVLAARLAEAATADHVTPTRHPRRSRSSSPADRAGSGSRTSDHNVDGEPLALSDLAGTPPPAGTAFDLMSPAPANALELRQLPHEIVYAEVADLAVATEALRSQLEAAERQCSDLVVVNAELTAAVAAAEADAAAAREAVSSQAAAAQQTSAELQTRMAAAEQDAATSRNAAVELRELMDAAVADLQAKLRAADDQITGLQDDLARSALNDEQVRADLKSAEEQRASDEHTIDELQSKVAAASFAATDAGRRVLELSAALSATEKQLAEAQTALAVADTSSSARLQELQEASASALATSTHERDALLQQVAELQNQLDEAVQAAARLEAQRDALQVVADEATAARAASDQRAAEALQQCTKAESAAVVEREAFTAERQQLLEQIEAARAAAAAVLAPPPVAGGAGDSHGDDLRHTAAFAATAAALRASQQARDRLETSVGALIDNTVETVRASEEVPRALADKLAEATEQLEGLRSALADAEAALLSRAAQLSTLEAAKQDSDRALGAATAAAATAASEAAEALATAVAARSAASLLQEQADAARATEAQLRGELADHGAELAAVQGQLKQALEAMAVAADAPCTACGSKDEQLHAAAAAKAREQLTVKELSARLVRAQLHIVALQSVVWRYEHVPHHPSAIAFDDEVVGHVEPAAVVADVGLPRSPAGTTVASVSSPLDSSPLAVHGADRSPASPSAALRHMISPRTYRLAATEVALRAAQMEADAGTENVNELCERLITVQAEAKVRIGALEDQLRERGDVPAGTVAARLRDSRSVDPEVASAATAAASERIISLESRLKEAETELAHLREAMTTMDSVASAAATTIAQFEAESADLHASLAAANAELEAAHARMEDLARAAAVAACGGAGVAAGSAASTGTDMDDDLIAAAELAAADAALDADLAVTAAAPRVIRHDASTFMTPPPKQTVRGAHAGAFSPAFPASSSKQLSSALLSPAVSQKLFRQDVSSLLDRICKEVQSTEEVRARYQKALGQAYSRAETLLAKRGTELHRMVFELEHKLEQAQAACNAITEENCALRSQRDAATSEIAELRKRETASKQELREFEISFMSTTAEFQRRLHDEAAHKEQAISAAHTLRDDLARAQARLNAAEGDTIPRLREDVARLEALLAARVAQPAGDPASAGGAVATVDAASVVVSSAVIDGRVGVAGLTDSTSALEDAVGVTTTPLALPGTPALSTASSAASEAASDSQSPTPSASGVQNGNATLTAAASAPGPAMPAVAAAEPTARQIVFDDPQLQALQSAIDAVMGATSSAAALSASSLPEASTPPRTTAPGTASAARVVVAAGTSPVAANVAPPRAAAASTPPPAAGATPGSASSAASATGVAATGMASPSTPTRTGGGGGGAAGTRREPTSAAKAFAASALRKRPMGRGAATAATVASAESTLPAGRDTSSAAPLGTPSTPMTFRHPSSMVINRQAAPATFTPRGGAGAAPSGIFGGASVVDLATDKEMVKMEMADGTIRAVLVPKRR